MEMGLALTLAGVAFVAILSAIGSAAGIAIAAEVVGGVLSEDPDKFGKLIVILALPGTQGFYGFLTGFYVMMKVGFLGQVAKVSVPAGIALLSLCVGVGLVEMISAYWQGRASMAAALLVAKKPEETGKAIILPAMVETYAVLGLLIGILVITGIKL
jgi:V/A-type H+-transporting ATPase subunit K